MLFFVLPWITFDKKLGFFLYFFFCILPYHNKYHCAIYKYMKTNLMSNVLILSCDYRNCSCGWKVNSLYWVPSSDIKSWFIFCTMQLYRCGLKIKALYFRSFIEKGDFIWCSFAVIYLRVYFYDMTFTCRCISLMQIFCYMYRT